MSVEDLDTLERNLLPFATEATAKHNIFVPFGGQIDSSGNFAFATAEGNNAEEVLAMLMSGMKKLSDSGKIRAGGVCYIWLNPSPSPSDSEKYVTLVLETNTGHIRYVKVPFRRRFLRKTWFGEKKVENKRGKQIFVDDEDVTQQTDPAYKQ